MSTDLIDSEEKQHTILELSKLYGEMGAGADPETLKLKNLFELLRVWPDLDDPGKRKLVEEMKRDKF